MRVLLLPGLLMLIAAGDASPFQIGHPWARASAGAAKNGAAYLTITGTGAADRLTGVESPVADKVEVHESFDDKGVMKMRPMPALPLEPGRTVAMAPGGYHIMMMGLKAPLKAGDAFPMTLRFEHAAPVTVTIQVEGRDGAMDHMHK